MSPRTFYYPWPTKRICKSSLDVFEPQPNVVTLIGFLGSSSAGAGADVPKIEPTPSKSCSTRIRSMRVASIDQ
jgi:hypothetical protein